MAYAEQVRALERPPLTEDPAAGESAGAFKPRPQRSAERDRYFARKWIFERLLGSLLLVLAAPLILLLCLLVKTTSKGPGLYRQVRLGYQGRHYAILKIRTMTIDAEADGVARWCTKNDPRITCLGRFLRKFHLDELPQLINVACGDMALVGPRPERPQISAKLAQDIDGYYDRLSVMPGITGLAQINLPPDETLDDARRKQILDLQYIEEAGFWLDVRMLAATGLRMCGIRGDAVTRSMQLCRKAKLDSLAPIAPQSETDFGTNVATLKEEIGCLSLDAGGACPRCSGDFPRHPR